MIIHTHTHIHFRWKTVILRASVQLLCVFESSNLNLYQFIFSRNYGATCFMVL
jgi:hypothetical protein